MQVVINLSKNDNDTQLKNRIEEMIRTNIDNQTTKIQNLIISYLNPGYSIPENIGKLESLVNLRIANCSISYLPDTIGNLNNLSYLEIIHCNIIFLPDTIGNLKNLSTLLLDYNSLIGEYGGIISQSSINDSNTNVNYIKRPIDNLAVLWKLTNLKTLSLSYNCIQALSNDITSLHKLQTLNINHNRLTKLPDCIINLDNTRGSRWSIANARFNPTKIDVRMNHFDTPTRETYKRIPGIVGVESDSTQIPMDYFAENELKKFHIRDREPSIKAIGLLTDPADYISTIMPTVQQNIDIYKTAGGIE